MNPYGSYRAFKSNADSALLAAIEIYNKPVFEYRTECFTVLLLNAWELLLKAILSKKRVRVFKKKERGKPYRTLDFYECLQKCKPLVPARLQYAAIAKNLEAVTNYRNNVIHFYNEPGLDVLMYGLAQTAITNYRDVSRAVFASDPADRINLSLLPLAFSPPPDPIAFLQEHQIDTKGPFATQYLRLIAEANDDLEKEGVDTARFLTVMRIKLESQKKSTAADLVAAVTGDTETHEGAQLVTRNVDPNRSHPLLQKHILDRIGSELNGKRFTSYVLQAIIHARDLKSQQRYAWHNETGKTYQYSEEVVAYLRSLSASQIDQAVQAYKKHRRAT